MLGYVRRKGVRINSLNSRLGPRPSTPRIRQIAFSFDFSHYYSLVHRALESRSISFSPLELSFPSGGILSTSVSQEVEQLFTPFGIHDDIQIPVGRHSFVRQSFSYSGPVNQPITYSISYDRGGFYTGNSDELSTKLNWRKSARLTTGIEFRQYWVRLEEGDFNTSLAILRFNYFFSPKIALTNFVQYDTDTSNIGLQSRLRWIIKPGQEVYLVFNHEWQENQFDRFEALRSDVRAKLNYTVRF